MKECHTKYDEVWSTELISSSFKYHGVICTGKVKDDLIWFITLVLCLWEDLLTRWGSPKLTVPGIRRLIHSIGECWDVDQFLGGLTFCKTQLLSWIDTDTGPTVSYARLKHAMKTNGFSSAYVSVLKPMFAQDVSDYTTETLVMRDLIQAFSFPLRFNPSLWWEKMDAGESGEVAMLIRDIDDFRRMNSVEQLLEDDANLEGEMPSDFIVSWVTDLLAAFDARLDGGLRPESFGFSGGATKELSRGSSSCMKWDYLWYKGLSAEHTALLEFLTGEAWNLSELGLPDCNYLHWCDTPARLQSVPKQWDKPRFITVEPTEMALLQKGVGDELILYLEEIGFVYRHFPIHDQNVSRQEILVASLSGEYCSIDLSSASDSVRWEWVQEMLCALPTLKRVLADCRSTRVEWVDWLGETHESPLKKWGGMGNRLTFPIEVIVFSSIVAEAARLSGVQESRYTWLVYGDDIIVHQSIYQTTVSLLQKYGFRVNLEKSYNGNGFHVFRESCGMWALDGYDVTPVLLSRKLPPIGGRYDRRVSAKALRGRPTNWPVSYVKLANELLTRRLMHARAFIVSTLFGELKPEEHPVFTPIGSDFGLWSSEPTNFEKPTVGLAKDVLATDKWFKVDYLNDCVYSLEENIVYAGHSEVSDQLSFCEVIRDSIFGATGEEPSVVKRASQPGETSTMVSRSLLQEVLRCMELRCPSVHEDDENWQPYDSLAYISESRRDVQTAFPRPFWRSSLVAT